MISFTYYNKESREGFPRWHLLTAAVDCHRTRRVRWQSTAKESKCHRGKSRRYFFILSTVPDPLRCSNMSKHTKTIHLTSPAMQHFRAGRYLLPFNTISGGVRFYKDARPGVSFQYLKDQSRPFHWTISRGKSVPIFRRNSWREPMTLQNWPLPSPLANLTSADVNLDTYGRDCS